ncbi:competence/damage-inducible protein A|uniref:Putative competence-damage inducible protein n=1 Tax=Dendrosporobacter quercicolus TaxID=146817 RepID=A0A1G9LNS6_9FIRM|nr:competence/damage-inducible protein A [Dendrosporobacter quercicolus]NSL46778.1 competence/damage-inducible protein A [Dendrosporobacter quercicolus DSM 1736]SDL63629.1 nicotinamide-nucleotide amidase [Dendrosporobacter quercicolus]
MIVEILTTGTELLLGQIVNTNAPYLAQQLNKLGFDVLYQTTIGDNRERMSSVLIQALSRADLVITSGGLGPTQGDITKEVSAQVFNRKLVLHEPSKAKIKCFFAERHAAMPESNLRQAMIPEGAVILNNERGTAPGVIIENNGKTLINLPGPPHELEFMFEQYVAPYLKGKYGVQGAIVSRVLRTYGLGESMLEEKIKDLILAQKNPTIALLARKGEVVIRLTARGETELEANQLIAELAETITPRISEYLFGIDDDNMEFVVGQNLLSNKLSLALAESCTGGLVSSRLTDIPGSSSYLQGSVVCYSNDVKVQDIGVANEILLQHGAVSEQTAIAMAAGIRRKFSTDIGVGVTGIAGPGGATADKPVGLVYIAIDGPAGPKCYKNHFEGQRTEIKFRSSQEALDTIRRYVRDLTLLGG